MLILLLLLLVVILQHNTTSITLFYSTVSQLYAVYVYIDGLDANLSRATRRGEYYYYEYVLLMAVAAAPSLSYTLI